MSYFLSVDGGGTKTAWLLTNETGTIFAENKQSGCSYPQIGLPETKKLLSEGLKELLFIANLNRNDIKGAAWGIPCYGEDETADIEINSFINSLIPGCSNTICNDAELGLAGSLLLQPGIHIISGTGAIAFGKDPSGKTARSNGWHPDFSDEGSAYWLGMQTLRLFTKQADLRIPRSCLYEIIYSRLNLKKDTDLLSYYDIHLAGDRAKIAQFQLLLSEAALMGDSSAIEIYEKAAYELYSSIKSVYENLDFPSGTPVKVSYSGGVFKMGDFILTPLTKELQKLPVILTPPYLSPSGGGILLALQHFCDIPISDIAMLLKKQEEENYNVYN